MSEFITIQGKCILGNAFVTCPFNINNTLVGQCGNQIGSAFWPLVLQEYGINNVPEAINKLHVNQKMQSKLQTSFRSFFQVPGNDKSNRFDTLADLLNSNVKARVST